jgi:hypothetical protein
MEDDKMIEDFTYNINLNHQYNDLEANYKVIVADEISHDPTTGDLVPLYTIITDDDYTGSNFSIYDSMNFNQQTDYFHRLHMCRFPVSGCFNGISAGDVKYQGEVLQDNDITPVPAAPIIVRLSNCVDGTPDYRTPVIYENGVSVVLKVGTTTVATKTSQSILPDPDTDNLNAGFIIFPAIDLGETYTLNFTYDSAAHVVEVEHNDKNGIMVDIFLEQLTT